MDDIKIAFCEYCDWLTFPRDPIQRSNKCPHCLGMTGHVVFVLSAISGGVLDNIMMRDLSGFVAGLPHATILGHAYSAYNLVFLPLVALIVWSICRSRLGTLLLLPVWLTIEDFACITILDPAPWFPRGDWIPPFSTPFWWGIPLGYWGALAFLLVWVILRIRPQGYQVGRLLNHNKR